MASPDDPRLVLVTAPDRERALDLARSLVDDRLLACANLLPGLTSVYRWEGRVQEDEEVLLIGKTRAGRVAALEARVLELHPYDTPEFVVLDPSHVEPRYLAWLAASTSAHA